jgi:hypothetical protein
MVKLRIVEPRRKEPDSEKITINLGYVDLGQIDLLVQEGFYSNRTDFIRTGLFQNVAVVPKLTTDCRGATLTGARFAASAR